MFTPKAEQFLKKEKKCISSALKPLGKVRKFLYLSKFDHSGVKSIKVAMTLNFKLSVHRGAARHGRCPPRLLRFLNHTCQTVKTSGSVGDVSPVGVSEFCYLCAQGAGSALRGERSMSAGELER